MRRRVFGLLAGVALGVALTEPARSAENPPDAAEPPAPAAPTPAPAASARTSRIQGSALLARGRPIAGATVVVERESAARDFYLTATDAKGTFRVDDLPEGTYRVQFSRDGLAPLVKTGIVVKPPFRGIVEVIMTPATTPPVAAPRELAGKAPDAPVRIKGLALDSQSRPVSDARIRMARTDEAADPLEALTGADGSFTLEALAPGRWVLESLGLAYLPLRGAFHVTADSTVHLVLVGQPATYQPPALDLLPREEPIPPAEGS